MTALLHARLPALMAAAGRPVAPGEALAVAVSGGPDSIALLAAAAAAFPGRVAALTVDHGLRAASAAEAAGVASQCQAQGIVHHTLVWRGQKPGADIQAAARAARYQLMLGWCQSNGVPLLLTAHHADDQAETLLMRLARGSGSGGLAGVRALRQEAGVDIVRPLLTLSRLELSKSAPDWTSITDPSNADPHYARTGVRSLLSREAAQLPASQLAASAAHLAAVEETLLWLTDQAWAGRATRESGTIRLDAAGLPDELRRRLLLRAIAEIAPDSEPPVAPRGPAVMRLLARLDSGRAATLAGVKVQPFGGLNPGWQVRKAPPRRQLLQNQAAK